MINVHFVFIMHWWLYQRRIYKTNICKHSAPDLRPADPRGPGVEARVGEGGGPGVGPGEPRDSQHQHQHPEDHLGEGDHCHWTIISLSWFLFTNKMMPAILRPNIFRSNPGIRREVPETRRSTITMIFKYYPGLIQIRGHMSNCYLS